MDVEEEAGNESFCLFVAENCLSSSLGGILVKLIFSA